MGFSDEACIGLHWKSARYETTIPLRLGMGCNWGEANLTLVTFGVLFVPISAPTSGAGNINVDRFLYLPINI
jgi:hypothetical protein